MRSANPAMSRQGSISSNKTVDEVRRDSALRLQRKQRLEMMVLKRQQNISYLRRFHQGGLFWLNCVLMTPSDLQRLTSSPAHKVRTVMYYYLGLSASKLLMNDGIKSSQFVCAFTQLMEEWEYYFSSPTMQGVKFVLARTSPTAYPHTNVSNSTEKEEDLIGRVSIYKHNGNVVYEHLMTPPIPFELDYIETLTSLSDVLISLYDKFLGEECHINAALYDAIMKLDSRVKHHFISLVSKEITETCVSTMKLKTQSLRNSTFH